MPFGLCNAAQRVCRLMDKAILQQIKTNAYVYLDNLLIINADFDTHMNMLSKVAHCLKRANSSIGMAKYHSF